MRHLSELALAIALLVALPVAAAGDDYDVKLAEARANLASAEGVAFDRALGEAIQTAAIESQWNACLAQHAPTADVHLEGFFEFPEKGAFRVVLRPATPLSRCLATAMESGDAPEPPSRPWYNHFVFALEAD